MPKHRLLPVLLTAMLYALATTAPVHGQAKTPLDVELEAILALLPGRYAGSRATGAQPDREGMLYHTIEPVALPEHGRTVLLHVLSTRGFDDPQPLQQKFYAFDERAGRTHNSMRSIVLVRAPRWQPGMALDEDSVIRFPPECAIRWHRDERGLVARVKRGDCVYRSEAFGGDIVPDMTYVATPESFAIEDTLYRPDGSAVIPRGGLLVAPRVAGE